jgi:catechol 2,3-dioxygenase-like lactoylglutathione lyase family enzyme
MRPVDAGTRRDEAGRMAVQLDHVILPVNDASESVAFYTDVLGFTDDGAQPPFSVVRVTPDFTLQLAPWGTEGNWHLAFAMTRAEFDDAFARVRDANIAFGDTFHDAANGRGPGDEPGARGPGKAIYLLDPNRHLIELRFYAE